MDISILLTTYNRNEDCMRCLDTLVPQLTDKIEVLLLDDYHIGSLKLMAYCEENDINYIHTGIQKEGSVLWRVPGFAYNIGARLAEGNYFIIGGAEIFHQSNNTIKQMHIPNTATAPIVYDTAKNGKKESKLNNKLPFCFGVPRTIYYDIGGYDEDMVGYCFDDNDFSDRVLSLIPFKEVDAEVIHLWNLRGASNRGDKRIAKKSAWNYNRNLYISRKNLIKRNINQDWGML